MKICWRVLFIFCLSYPVAHAGELELSYGYGPRDENLRWAISGDITGNAPNIMSELTWRNLQGSEHYFGLDYTDSSGWMGRADIRIADLNKGGEVQDSDYQYDNRQGENRRSLSATQGSNAQDIALLIGKRLYLDEPVTWSITPVIGLSRNITDLRMNNGVTVIDPLSTGPIANLDSSYRARFDSVMAGVETRWWFMQPFGLGIKWHHSWLNYYAEANWNKRDEFQHPVSFYHEGQGIEDLLVLSFLTRLDKNWTMELSHTVRQGIVQNGLDVANMKPNLLIPKDHQLSTLLRDVEWSSAATSLVVHRVY